ncbi:MAG: hypothetical protein HYS43_01545 [Candidatus Liptonbacteria bacterium]|nr:hypothetical protein [Candidatus Liptonbacteria bacterium]
MDGMRFPSSIFHAYDIRGVYPREFNAATVAGLAGIIAARLYRSVPQKRPFVIGYDGRKDSAALAEAAGAVVEKQVGAPVVRIGLATTPMFYFFVHRLRSAGGIMITASHNPKQYNGMKVVGPDAAPIGGKEIENWKLQN